MTTINNQIQNKYVHMYSRVYVYTHRVSFDLVFTFILKAIYVYEYD